MFQNQAHMVKEIFFIFFINQLFRDKYAVSLRLVEQLHPWKLKFGEH